MADDANASLMIGSVLEFRRGHNIRLPHGFPCANSFWRTTLVDLTGRHYHNATASSSHWEASRDSPSPSFTCRKDLQRISEVDERHLDRAQQASLLLLAKRRTVTVSESQSNTFAWLHTDYWYIMLWSYYCGTHFRCNHMLSHMSSPHQRS
jgi:hypothetical protein